MKAEGSEKIAQTDVVVEEVTTLVSISFGDGWALLAEFHVFIWASFIAVVAVAMLSGWTKIRLRSYEIDEAEFGIGNQKLKIRPNTVDAQIAYRIWVELSTRKIGLPIEEKHDVISEVYNSWYEFFSVTRSLIGDIPATKIRRKDTRAVVNLSIDVLNNGLRPHLTRWQAKYRKWFDKEIESSKNESKSPQEIQREYPKYDELMADLKTVNRRLVQYRDHMYKLAFGD